MKMPLLDEPPMFRSSRNCLFEGAYILHLKRLLHERRGVPRHMLRIYWSDDFFSSPSEVLRDAMKFIGADPAKVDIQKITQSKYNIRKPTNSKNQPAEELCPTMLKRMYDAMRPFDDQLETFLGSTPPWRI